MRSLFGSFVVGVGCDGGLGARFLGYANQRWLSNFKEVVSKIESVVLVGQKSVICYIQMVVVALLSVDLVESVDLVSVDLVVNCIFLLIFYLCKNWKTMA